MTAWPTELKLDKDKRTLIVSFDDGASYDLPAEVLPVDVHRRPQARPEVRHAVPRFAEGGVVQRHGWALAATARTTASAS